MPPSIVAALVASSLLVSISRAQEPPNLGRRVSLVVGPLFISQRDENASPMRYSGAAPFLQIGYAALSSRRAIEVRVGGGLGTLRSALTGDNGLPHQTTGRSWAELEYRRLLGPRDARIRWLLGGLFAAHATVILHYGAAAGDDDAGYAFFTTTVGPVVALERASGQHTTLRARLSVPVVTLIGRPYTVFYALYYDPRPNTDGLHLRVATVDTFQGADFTASYTTALRRSADLVVGYHIVAERYLDAEPFRFASQGMSLALALRLGGGQ